MTTNEITETLTEIEHAVEVPPVDQVAFQRLVTRERRRRATGRVLVASAAAVVLAAGVGLVVQLNGDSEVSPAQAPDESRTAFEPMREQVPFLRDGVLQVRLPGGTVVDTGEHLEEVLGLTGRGVVAVDRDSKLLLVPVRANGHIGAGTPLVDGIVRRGVVAVDRDSKLLLVPVRANGHIGAGTPIVDGVVRRAWLSKDRATIGWMDLDDVVHLRQLGADHDYWSGELSSQQELMAVDGDHWVEGTQDLLNLRYADSSADVHPVDGVVTVELAGTTLAVGGLEGIEVFSAVDGSSTWPGGIGGSRGALSPDGHTYAAGYPQEHVEHGASQILEVFDTADGSTRTITNVDYDGVLDISWTGTNFLVLITLDGKSSVLECSAEALACAQLVEPTAAALQLPSS